MILKRARWLSAVAILVVLTFPGRLAAAQAPPRYIAIDIGTLGGPNALPNEPGHNLTNSGIVAGSAETPAINPFTQECNGCHVADAIQWRKGVMTDLGTLGGYNAGLFEINGSGIGVGFSELATLDPQTQFPEGHAAISRQGRLIDLGTLGGNESWANQINDRGQIAGEAANTIPDAYAPFLSVYPSATQWRAALWQGSKVHDLGTLGGPDSMSIALNEHGQVAGWSFTNSTPSVLGIPTMDPFLWENGRMRDLGSLGGTLGSSNWMNSSGEVVGQSDLAGDQVAHPFLWNGSRLVDLGTLGGTNGAASWINDAGTVVGVADRVSGHHAFLWRNGGMIDLGTADGDPCSFASGINASGQVVGSSTSCSVTLAATLWDAGHAYDLNTVISPEPYQLTNCIYINDRGEILTSAVLPNGAQHLVLLVPADQAASVGLSTVPMRYPAATTKRAAGVMYGRPDQSDILGPARLWPARRFHRLVR